MVHRCHLRQQVTARQPDVMACRTNSTHGKTAKPTVTRNKLRAKQTQHLALQILLIHDEQFILKNSERGMREREPLKREWFSRGIFKNGNFVCCNIDQRTEVYIT